MNNWIRSSKILFLSIAIVGLWMYLWFAHPYRLLVMLVIGFIAGAVFWGKKMLDLTESKSKKIF